ncbi:hypothetical protein ACFLVN_02630 [Chloroflexota bacterium]
MIALASPAFVLSERLWLSILATHPAIANKTSPSSPGSSVQPLENWAEVLSSIEYSHETVEITDQKITAVTGKELTGKKWKTVYSAPDLPPNGNGKQTEVTDDVMREAIKGQVFEIAEELCVQAGYAAGFRGEVYSALMQHIRTKFLDNATLGLAERRCLDYAWKMLDQVKAKVSVVPGLIGGIIEYANK